MFDWLKRPSKKGSDSAGPKPDPVGVGKIVNPEEVKARPGNKSDSAVSSIMLAAKLREIGVSSEVTKLLEKHHFRVRVEEVQELSKKWSKDLEYEGYKIELTPDKVVWAMIGTYQLQVEREKKIKDLDSLMKKTLTPEQREKSFNLRVELGKPVNVIGVLIWQEAERLLRQEIPDDNKAPDPSEVELVIERLRQAAWKAKANRLANAEARFELRKKYPDQPIPEDEFKELGLRHFKEYTKKHPFNPGAGFGKM